jgi:hypothetical protein
VKRAVKRSSKVSRAHVISQSSPCVPIGRVQDNLELLRLGPRRGAWPRQRHRRRETRTSGFWGQDGPTPRGRRGPNDDRREAYRRQRLAGAVDGRWGGNYGSDQRKEVFSRIGRRRREDVRPIGLDERVERELRRLRRRHGYEL